MYGKQQMLLKRLNGKVERQAAREPQYLLQVMRTISRGDRDWQICHETGWIKTIKRKAIA